MQSNFNLITVVQMTRRTMSSIPKVAIKLPLHEFMEAHVNKKTGPSFQINLQIA